MRKIRKDEHLNNYFKCNYNGQTLFDDVYIEHNSLPELSFDEIDTSVEMFGKKVEFPLIINAMTGGTDLSAEINSDLSILANIHGLPMAVGSQKIALEDETSKESFQIIRETLENDTLVIGNLDAKASLEDIDNAMEMIDANAIGLHLNPAQELVMDEGDRDFRGILNNISKVANQYSDKLIVKEVGYGMSVDVVKKLVDAGVKYLDISGFGGTNFTEIEDMRDSQADFSDLYDWGIPTAKSIINARSVSKEVKIIASGGIKTAMDIVKAIILGADYVAISGEILKYINYGDIEYASNYVNSLIYKTKILMALLGARNIDELKRVPYKTHGRLSKIL